ncbi:hypothetical protein Tco_0969865 [Tanacetum coccineum]
MVVQNQSELGEGLANPTDPHHTPTIIQSSTQPQKTQKPRKPKRKDTQVPQPSDPSENVVDEAVHKELGDSLVRVATTASSLEAEQDSDEEITLVSVQDDADKEMFDVDALNGYEVFVARQNENVVEEVVDVAQVSTAATIVTITTEEITLAQALEALKTSKPKVKVIVFQEPGKSTTTTTISSQQSHDKGKGIMIEEPVKPIKKKDQISFDKETALNLQAEFHEEERLIDADHQLAKRLQAQEQEELEDLEDLYKLVKAKFESTKPMEDLDLLLWGDLKTMFEPHVEDAVWRNQQAYKVLDWKLYDSCGVHSLRMQYM